MKAMEHPNVIQLFHTVETIGNVYLVMEHSGGDSYWTTSQRPLACSRRRPREYSGKSHVPCITATRRASRTEIWSQRTSWKMLEETLNSKTLAWAADSWLGRSWIWSAASPIMCPRIMPVGSIQQSRVGQLVLLHFTVMRYLLFNRATLCSWKSRSCSQSMTFPPTFPPKCEASSGSSWLSTPSRPGYWAPMA